MIAALVGGVRHDFEHFFFNELIETPLSLLNR